jgi:sugar phosphate isomerase/epimerase
LKIGVHGAFLSHPYGKGKTPQEVVNITSQAGIECLTVPVRAEIWGINPEHINEEKITEISGLFNDVEATALGFCWSSEYKMVTDSTTEWDKNLAYTYQLCDIASALKTKHIVLGAAGRSIPNNVPYYDGVKKLVKFWKQASQYAEARGVIYCMEQTSNARCNVGTNSKSLIDIVDAVDSPSFQVIAQIHDMAVNDLDVPAAILSLRERIKQVHVADVPSFNPLIGSNNDTLFPSEGVIDFSRVFRALKEIGFDGEICIEKSLGDDPVYDLRRCREYIESKWEMA